MAVSILADGHAEVYSATPAELKQIGKGSAKLYTILSAYFRQQGTTKQLSVSRKTITHAARMHPEYKVESS